MALAAAEGRDERETFAIVGARPSSMRRLAAASAAVVPLCGIVLGVPLGYLPVRVVDHITRHPFDQYRVPVRFPLLVVIALLMVIPLVAAAGAWTATALGQRFRPPKPTRRD